MLRKVRFQVTKAEQVEAKVKAQNQAMEIGQSDSKEGYLEVRNRAPSLRSLEEGISPEEAKILA